uniref:DUF4939 domain-containing protein n=1 Tax=Astatotilapia calliptera TaxID=8154 RepID=A0A3P8NYP3_ASTCA
MDSADSDPVQRALLTQEAPGRTMPSPEPFTGELEKCSGFLAQVSLFFPQENRTYASDGARIAFFVQLLRDRALQWAQALLKTLLNVSYLDFLTEFKGVFERDGGWGEGCHM